MRRTPVAVDHRGTRRPARAEQVHAVVAARERALEVDRADGDHRRVNAGRADRAVGFLTERVQAVVASGDDDRDSRGRRAPHSDAERVGQPALGRIRGEADVQHLDVVFPGVVDDPLDSLQRIAQRARAEVVEHLHVVDVGAGRDAGGIGRRAVVARRARRDRGDVRAVAVRVLRQAGVVGDRRLEGGELGASGRERGRAGAPVGPVGGAGVAQVDVALDARGALAVEERPMRLHHARIEHRDADAAAVQLRGVALEVAGAHVAGQGSGDRFEGARRPAGDPVRRHARDITALGQPDDMGRAHLHGQRPQGRMDGVDRAAGAQHRRAQVRHRGIGRVADDDRLDVADSVQVAHPARLRLACLAEAGRQIACDLRLRRKRLRLGVRTVESRHPDKQGQRDDEPRQNASRPAFVGRNDGGWDRIHVCQRKNTSVPHRQCAAARARVQLPLYREAPALV